VGDVVSRRVGASVLRRRGAFRAPRVEENERGRRAEAAEVGEVARRVARAAGMADEQRAGALTAVGQGTPVLRAERLGHGLFFPTRMRSLPVRSTTILPSYPRAPSIPETYFA